MKNRLFAAVVAVLGLVAAVVAVVALFAFAVRLLGCVGFLTCAAFVLSGLTSCNRVSE